MLREQGVATIWSMPSSRWAARTIWSACWPASRRCGFPRHRRRRQLLVAYRRAANIVRIEEKKDGRTYGDAPEAALLELPEEAALFEHCG